MIKQFIESIREEKDGFSFDQPWRLEKKSLGVIIPILRESRKKRTYITLAEAGQIKVEDTGQIDYVFVKNDESRPVLISRGEIFRGKTQERAAIHDHIIEPGKGLRVAVRCIHASKGIQSKANMHYGGRTPYDVTFETQSRTWENVGCYAHELSNTMNVYSSGQSGGSVLRTSWDSETNQDTFRSISNADDLVGTLDEMSEAMKVAMRKIPEIKNQVGAAFFYENRLRGMDVYDLSMSWKAIKQEVVAKEGADFLKQDESEMFKFKPEKGKKLIRKILSAPFEEKEIYNREYRLIELRGEKLIGEAVEYKNNVIHLTFWEKK